MIGQIVNYRYEVLEKIGDGDLFAVYKARDKVLNRLVALKVLSRELAQDKTFAMALISGYRDLSGLTHPNLARVLDADCTPEDCVVAAEYARGINLKERVLKAGAVSVPLALDIMVPVLEALEYAHSNKIIHGDIRPQDIIVSPDGEVRLTDFGLSRTLQDFPAIAGRYPMRSIQYQAPEQVEGGAPTVASDIYSVGAILYEMLTNTLPFDGGSAVAVALKKVKEVPVVPRSINAGVPKTLSDIIMKALEVSPADRYASVSAMLAELRALRDSLKTGQPIGSSRGTVVARAADAEEEYPEESLKRGFWWLLGLFVAVMVVVGAVTWLFLGQRGGIRVPPLLGKTWEEAQYVASEQNIELVDDGRMFSDTYPAGQICVVIPPVGSMVSRDNPVVKVKISNGPSLVVVPDLTGMTEPSANAAAVEAGFTIGKIKMEYSDKVPEDSIISQEPAPAERRAPGGAIDLVISQGPKPAEPSSEPTTQPDTSGDNVGGERRFNVSVEVPDDADGAQDVIIKVDDDRGETTAYDDQHEPGDKFTRSITVEGSKARIRVYIGGKLSSDSTY